MTGPRPAPADAMVVEMRGIVKHFGALTAVAGVDFDLRFGEIHGLLGENGAGKTTLMNLLYGLEQPDEGVIKINSEPAALRSAHDAIDRGVGMVHQHFQLVPRLSVAENVILGRGGSGLRHLGDIAATAEEVSEFSRRHGLPVDGAARVAELSVGEQQRVEILRALYRGARILILDEPTATLTPAEVANLIEKLKAMAVEGTSIVMITHHLDEVITAADRITVLRNGAKVATVPARASSPRELARLMVGRDVDILADATHRPSRARTTGPATTGSVVLTIERLCSHQVGHAQRPDAAARSFTDVDLRVRAGEIVSIAGVEGNGQSELEEALTGLRRPAEGRVLLEGDNITGAPPARLLDAGVAVVPSDRYRRGLIRELTVAQNLVCDRIDRPPYGSTLRLNPKAIEANGARLIAEFSVAACEPSTPAGRLSGGNAQKVVLARALGKGKDGKSNAYSDGGSPRLLIAAQPTRGLDVGAIEFVWELLRARRDEGLAVLLITTDLDEAIALSDRCFVIYRGRVTAVDVDRERIGLAMGGAGAVSAPSAPAPKGSTVMTSAPDVPRRPTTRRAVLWGVCPR